MSYKFKALPYVSSSFFRKKRNRLRKQFRKTFDKFLPHSGKLRSKDEYQHNFAKRLENHNRKVQDSSELITRSHLWHEFNGDTFGRAEEASSVLLQQVPRDAVIHGVLQKHTCFAREMRTVPEAHLAARSRRGSPDLDYVLHIPGDELAAILAEVEHLLCQGFLTFL